MSANKLFVVKQPSLREWAAEQIRAHRLKAAVIVGAYCAWPRPHRVIGPKQRSAAKEMPNCTTARLLARSAARMAEDERPGVWDRLMRRIKRLWR